MICWRATPAAAAASRLSPSSATTSARTSRYSASTYMFFERPRVCMNRFSMSRDWLAVLLALLAVVLVKLGVIDGVPW